MIAANGFDDLSRVRLIALSMASVDLLEEISFNLFQNLNVPGGVPDSPS